MLGSARAIHRIDGYNLCRIRPLDEVIRLIQDWHPILLAVRVRIVWGRDSEPGIWYLSDGLAIIDDLRQFHPTFPVRFHITSNSADVQLLIPAKESGILESDECPAWLVL